MKQRRKYSQRLFFFFLQQSLPKEKINAFYTYSEARNAVLLNKTYVADLPSSENEYLFILENASMNSAKVVVEHIGLR